MSSIQEAYQTLSLQLTPIYGQREAQSIARIVFEDAFNIFDFTSTTPFLFEDSLHKITHRLAVLIPRPETEELVYWILEDLKLKLLRQGKEQSPTILDIGTGSGCIPITLKKRQTKANVFAMDISLLALKIATENAELNEVVITFICQNILATSAWTRKQTYDIIVSNPPYIPTKESDLMPTWVKDFEPSIALFVSNEDPLLFYRTIADFALLHLKNGGVLYFESNEYNAQEVAVLLRTKGFQGVFVNRDMSGKERMVKGVLKTIV